MVGLLKLFCRDESAASSVEYGLIAALIATVCISTMSKAGSKLNVKFTSLSNGLN